MRIGPYTLSTNLILAPMAGVTDRPFRRLCRKLGAGLAVAEMTYANPALRKTRKSQSRLDLGDSHSGEPEPRSVQIAGTDPMQLAEFAKDNVTNGAQIIDINMGCPAKKVCSIAAGSALLRDESLVAQILQAVVHAVDVPVTLKARTGWDRNSRNIVHIARMAEDIGISAISIHGRTREDRYNGDAEYESIAEVKSLLNIPVIANGDIQTPHHAKQVLQQTNADGLMIGRAAQGNPWIFQQITSYLRTGDLLGHPSQSIIKNEFLLHISEVHQFYGEYLGVRIARKHIQWYVKNQPGSKDFWTQINQVDSSERQLQLINDYMSG